MTAIPPGYKTPIQKGETTYAKQVAEQRLRLARTPSEIRHFQAVIEQEKAKLDKENKLR